MSVTRWGLLAVAMRRPYHMQSTESTHSHVSTPKGSKCPQGPPESTTLNMHFLNCTCAMPTPVAFS